jgi:hypothetical protein
VSKKAFTNAVLGIWIRIRMFLGLPDPDPDLKNSRLKTEDDVPA